MEGIVNFSEIIEQAERRGYFAFVDFPGLKLDHKEVKLLKETLKKKNIPFKHKGSAEIFRVLPNYSKADAAQIITALRKGVPPPIGVSRFSVGRQKLVDRMRNHLNGVASGTSRVCFMNADYGLGKTHSLYLLREIAFYQGFAVSIVTLSETSCPIHDFMTVYDKVMWNLRTQEQRSSPALENVLDRWLQLIRDLGEERARHLIMMLPDNLKSALNAYYESQSPIRPNEEKRMLVLDYLSGKNIYLRDLKRFDINVRIDSSNALLMLGYMSSLFRNLGYKGICILFDEADPIHSFARYDHQDEAYRNLFRIIRNSQQSAHCYFLYATTPTFFDNYLSYWPSKNKISDNDVFELERLNVTELRELGSNIHQIYCVYKGKERSDSTDQLLWELPSKPGFSDSIGNFVRRCIGIMDELV